MGGAGKALIIDRDRSRRLSRRRRLTLKDRTAGIMQEFRERLVRFRETKDRRQAERLVDRIEKEFIEIIDLLEAE